MLDITLLVLQFYLDHDINKTLSHSLLFISIFIIVKSGHLPRAIDDQDGHDHPGSQRLGPRHQQIIRADRFTTAHAKHIIRETRTPIPARPGQLERHDYEYERCGVCNVFMASEPLAGTRMTKVTDRKTKVDWAQFLQNIAEHYQAAQKITLVMDNLNTHRPGALYEAFPPDKAKALWDRFEFVYTPKHGSWLNVVEIELNVNQPMS